jgi:SagB-type dehydrogenase family enzyme
MINIPHDYYIKLLDQKVNEEVLEFHNKGNFTLHECVSNISLLHNLPAHLLSDLTGNELQIYPDMDITTKGPTLDPLAPSSPLYRNQSCDYFDGTGIAFESITQLLSPLLKKDETSYRRGYPSAGALYSVEVFCCSLSPHNTWPCPEKILHLLPNSRKLEIVQDSHNNSTIIEAILPKGNKIGTPSLAIVYTIYMPKTLFKYRYRGYRLALMEAGSMYMLVDLQCKHVNLKSRQWSGYTDNMLCRAMGLNPTLFYPSCVQLIGG